MQVLSYSVHTYIHTEREGGGLSLGEAGKRGCSLPHVAILERILHAGIRDSLLRARRAGSIKKEREEGGGGGGSFRVC